MHSLSIFSKDRRAVYECTNGSIKSPFLTTELFFHKRSIIIFILLVKIKNKWYEYFQFVIIKAMLFDYF